jgi:hypothetical protein
MKQIQLFAAALLALAILIGCAGSDGNSPNTTGGVLTGTPRIEAVVKIDRTNLKDPNQYTDAELMDPTKVNPNDLVNPTVYGVQDPRNIQAGEKYWFQLVSYDESGNRQIIDGDILWTLSDPRFADLGSNSGSFVAGDNTTQTSQFVFADYKGTRYQAAYAVKPRQVRLIGKVLLEEGDKPLAGIDLFFFDNFNQLVGVVRTGYDGVFRASVPTNTVLVSPTVESIPNEYYQSFLFEGLRYSVGFPQCKAPLQPLEIGTVQLDSPIYLKTRVEGQDTPSPTGCTL